MRTYQTKRKSISVRNPRAHLAQKGQKSFELQRKFIRRTGAYKKLIKPVFKLKPVFMPYRVRRAILRESRDQQEAQMKIEMYKLDNIQSQFTQIVAKLNTQLDNLLQQEEQDDSKSIISISSDSSSKSMLIASEFDEELPQRRKRIVTKLSIPGVPSLVIPLTDWTDAEEEDEEEEDEPQVMWDDYNDQPAQQQPIEEEEQEDFGTQPRRIPSALSRSSSSSSLKSLASWK